MSKFDVYYEGEDGLPILAKSQVEAGSDRAAVEEVCEMFRWNDDGVWAVPAGAAAIVPAHGAAAEAGADIVFNESMWDLR